VADPLRGDVVAIVLGVVTMAGCAADKAPPRAEVTAAETEINSGMAEANAYVPDQAQSLRTGADTVVDEAEQEPSRRHDAGYAGRGQERPR